MALGLNGRLQKPKPKLSGLFRPLKVRPKNCCAYLVDACLNLLHVKRGNVTLSASQYRYLKDTQRLFASERNELPRPIFLSANECLLLSVVLTGVPLFNRMRNGCTPYVEVYNKDKRIFTNIQDYDQMK